LLRPCILLVAAAVIAAPVGAQNLLVNPGFDEPDQITGWTCDTLYGTAVWSPIDRNGAPQSGSMEHEVDASTDNQKERCWQCVGVDELTPYLGEVWFFWPDDPDVSQLGTTRMSVNFYFDADCTDDTGVYDVAVGTPMLDSWQVLRTDEMTAPAGTHSAAVYLFTWQNLADQPVRARLDDIELSTTLIFGDGFESGDLIEWSGSSP
jgi:hypothetical protein